MKPFLRYFIWGVGLLVLLAVINLWPYTTENSETKDGITITEYRRHYFFDVHDGGIGRWLDVRVCIDAAKVCVRAERVHYSYPSQMPDSKWADLCDTQKNQYRFFNRISGTELKCHNCDAEALRCPKPPQNGTWFSENKTSEIVGYVAENQSTVRTYTFSQTGVTMSVLPTISGFVYGANTTIYERFLDDRSKLAWVDCSDSSCNFYTLDFLTGKFVRESTPCKYGNKLKIESIDNLTVLKIQFNAKGDEICRRSDGSPAYPIEAVPPPLPQFVTPQND